MLFQIELRSYKSVKSEKPSNPSNPLNQLPKLYINKACQENCPEDGLEDPLSAKSIPLYATELKKSLKQTEKSPFFDVIQTQQSGLLEENFRRRGHKNLTSDSYNTKHLKSSHNSATTSIANTITRVSSEQAFPKVFRHTKSKSFKHNTYIEGTVGTKSKQPTEILFTETNIDSSDNNKSIHELPLSISGLKKPRRSVNE